MLLLCSCYGERWLMPDVHIFSYCMMLLIVSSAYCCCWRCFFGYVALNVDWLYMLLAAIDMHYFSAM